MNYGAWHLEYTCVVCLWYACGRCDCMRYLYMCVCTCMWHMGYMGICVVLCGMHGCMGMCLCACEVYGSVCDIAVVVGTRMHTCRLSSSAYTAERGRGGVILSGFYIL